MIGIKIKFHIFRYFTCKKVNSQLGNSKHVRGMIKSTFVLVEMLNRDLDILTYR